MELARQAASRTVQHGDNVMSRIHCLSTFLLINLNQHPQAVRRLRQCHVTFRISNRGQSRFNADAPLQHEPDDLRRIGLAEVDGDIIRQNLPGLKRMLPGVSICHDAFPRGDTNQHARHAGPNRAEGRCNIFCRETLNPFCVARVDVKLV